MQHPPRYLRLAATAGLLIVVLSGCRYPEFGTKAYELTKALYSACNRKSTEHLDKVEQMTDAARKAGEISEEESDWLKDVVDEARGGDWESAAEEARKIMEDQVRE